jgi:indolepyruvate ferredoxin oxidoreductase beta subunit
METNIILAGVGGQGIVSISFVIDMAAIWQGLQFKQAEVHGMSQRGGAVSSHLRISDSTIHSDLVPKGTAHIILAVEPIESLRYVDYLSPTGTVVAGTDPFINIADYPEVDRILDGISTLASHTLVAADRLARQAGSGRAQNMVLLGAASPYLGLRVDLLERGIHEAFAAKGDKIQKTNLNAFRSGIAAGESYRSCLQAGMSSRQARALVARLAAGALAPDAVPLWKHLFTQPAGMGILDLLTSQTAGKVQGSVEIPKAIAAAGSAAADQLPSLLFKA